MKRLTLLFVLTMTCAISARGSVEGDSFQIQWLDPNVSTVFDAGNSSSVTVPGTWQSTADPEISIALTDGQIVINLGNAGFSTATFNGFVLTDLSEVPDFSSLTLASVSGGLSATPSLSYTTNSLYVNFSGDASEEQTTSYTFDFTEDGAGVPDGGSTLSLLGLAVAGLACLRRRIS